MIKKNKEEMIEDCLNAVIPDTYAKYPKSWYEKLTEQQVFRMWEKIVVIKPSEEDYIKDIIDNTADVVPSEEDMLRDIYPTFPYRFNEASGELEVYTDGHVWETVND